MSEKRPYKRKQFYIKKDYQLRFILKFCFIILVGAFISTGLLFLFSQGTLTSSFEHSRLLVRDTSFAILPAAILTNIITLILITLAAIVVVLFISHKIAGPMFRFEKDLNEIGQGDFTKKVTLRKKDQFTDMADSLNNMTTNLHGKVLAIQTEVEQLLESASKQKAPERLIGGLNHLHQSIHKHFKI